MTLPTLQDKQSGAAILCLLLLYPKKTTPTFQERFHCLKPTNMRSDDKDMRTRQTSSWIWGVRDRKWTHSPWLSSFSTDCASFSAESTHSPWDFWCSLHLLYVSSTEKTVYSGFIQTDWGLNESFLHGHAASYESWTAFDRIDKDSCRGSAGSQCGLSCGVSEHKS